MKKPVKTPVESMHEHAAKCNRMLSDCKVCHLNMAAFAVMPLLTLSVALSEPPMESFKASMAAMLVERVVNRPIWNGSMRGTNSHNLTVAYLKGFERRGGKI